MFFGDSSYVQTLHNGDAVLLDGQVRIADTPVGCYYLDHNYIGLAVNIIEPDGWSSCSSTGTPTDTTNHGFAAGAWTVQAGVTTNWSAFNGLQVLGQLLGLAQEPFSLGPQDNHAMRLIQVNACAGRTSCTGNGDLQNCRLAAADTGATDCFVSPTIDYKAYIGQGFQNWSATLFSPPTISKSFGAATIPVGGTTTMSITIAFPNSNPANLTGIAFTDSLPSGLVVGNTPGVTGSCGGSVTATAASGTVSVAGGTLTPGGTCTITVNVKGKTAGVQNNSVTVSSTEGGTGDTATASITVVAPPTITKSFGAATIPLTGTTSLSFTVTNPNTTVALGGVGFTDNLPGGLIVATPNGLAGSCGGGTITATAGASSVSLSGATLAVSSSCTFSVYVKGTAAGVNNNSVTATSTNGGTGPAGTASITVVAPPTIAKSFTPATISVNGTSTLSFTITNPNATVALTGVGFTDTLPSGVFVSFPNGRSGSCGGGTITAVSSSDQVSLAGATLAASASCTFSLHVTSEAAGALVNTTDPVTSANGGTGTSATATLTVLAPDLAVTKRHSGDFTRGQTGVYTIFVSNVGPGSSSGQVKLVDTLPGFMSPVGVTAPGWACTFTSAQVTCVRSDGLATGGTYPTITLTVRNSVVGAGRWINVARLSGGSDDFNGNNVATDLTVVH
jgi:uncharacterized repeat protein (TIGR01451 family)